MISKKIKKKLSSLFKYKIYLIISGMVKLLKTETKKKLFEGIKYLFKQYKL